MGEKETLIKEEVKYSGLGSFKDAYAFAHSWLKESGFGITEDAYSEKIKGNEKDIDVSWNCSKKLSDYFKALLAIKISAKGVTDVEVEIDGKRKQMNKFGEIKISIKGTIERDAGNKWGGTSMQQFFKDTYHKYVIPQRVSEREDAVVSIVQDFKEQMKTFFELSGRR